MTDQRVLRTLMRFGIDPASTASVKQQLAKISGEFEALKKKATETQAAIEARKGLGHNYADLTKELKETEAQMAKLGAAARKTQADAFKAQQAQFAALREDAEKVTNLGTRMAVIGGAIAAPFVLAANAYVQKMGQSEATSAKWLASTKSLEDSYLRIGRVATSTLDPFLERAASVAEKAAALIEKNPEIAGAALGLGGTILAVGTLASVLSQGAMAYATISLLAAKIQEAAAAKQVAAATINAGAANAAAGTAGAAGAGVGATIAGVATGGVLLGAAAYDYGARNMGLGGGANLGQFASAAANGLGQLSDALGLTKSAGNDWFVAVSKVTNATDAETQAKLDAAVATKNGTGAMTRLNGIIESTAAKAGVTAGVAERWFALQSRYEQVAAQQAKVEEEKKTMAAGTDLYMQYQDEEAAALAATNDRRADLINAAGKNELEIAQNTREQNVKAALDFASDEKQRERDYYRNRQERMAAFSDGMAQLEEDYQTKRTRAAADNADEIDELGRQGDALGIVKALRRQEKERQRADEDQRKEVAQRNKAAAESLRDADDQFRRERSQRLDDFNTRTREQAAQLASEKAKRTADLQARLTEIDTQYQAEKVKRQARFVAQLNDLGIFLGGEQKLRQERYKLMEADFKIWLDNMRGIVTGTTGGTSGGGSGGGTTYPPVPMNAAGGYLGYGLHMVGDDGRGGSGPNEFLLSGQTTRAAESLIGGRLTQDRLLASMGRGGSGGLNIGVGDIIVNGGDTASIVRQAVSAFEQRLTNVLEKVQQQRKAQYVTA